MKELIFDLPDGKAEALGGTAETYTHYAHTANNYALGNGEKQALAHLKKWAGSSALKESGYEIIEFSRPLTLSEIDVDPVNGRLRIPDGVKCTSLVLIRNTAKEL